MKEQKASMGQPEHWPFIYSKQRVFDRPFDPSRCCAMVSEAGRGVSVHQCMKKALYQRTRDGVEYAFCGVHDPVRRARRVQNRPPTQYEREVAAAEARQKEVEDLRAENDRLKKVVARLEAKLHRLGVFPND